MVLNFSVCLSECVCVCGCIVTFTLLPESVCPLPPFCPFGAIVALFAPSLLKLLLRYAWISLPHSNFVLFSLSLSLLLLLFVFLAASAGLCWAQQLIFNWACVLPLRFFYPHAARIFSLPSPSLCLDFPFFFSLCFSSAIFINKFACQMTLFIVFLYERHSHIYLDPRPSSFCHTLLTSLLKYVYMLKLVFCLCRLPSSSFTLLALFVCLSESWQTKWIRNWVSGSVSVVIFMPTIPVLSPSTSLSQFHATFAAAAPFLFSPDSC